MKMRSCIKTLKGLSLFMLLLLGIPISNHSQMLQDSTVQSFFSAGDALRLSVYPDSASFVKGVYHIDDQGYVDLPIIGLTKVTTLSPKELEIKLRSIYLNYIPQPNIQAQPLIRASVLGGFFRPGLFYVDPRLSLWDLIYMAGGTVREDGFRKIQWERNREILVSDVVPYIESGQSLRSIGFQSGDQLWVTHQPKRAGWEIFRTEILPVIGDIAQALSSIILISEYIRNLDRQQQ